MRESIACFCRTSFGSATTAISAPAATSWPSLTVREAIVPPMRARAASSWTGSTVADHRLLVGDVGEMDHERLGGPGVSREKQQGGRDDKCGASIKSLFEVLTIYSVSAKLAIMNLEELQSKAGAAEAHAEGGGQPQPPRHPLRAAQGRALGERAAGRDRAQPVRALSASRASWEDELVATRRESQTIYYSLSSKPITRLIGLLYELYCAPHCDGRRRPPR